MLDDRALSADGDIVVAMRKDMGPLQHFWGVFILTFVISRNGFAPNFRDTGCKATAFGFQPDVAVHDVSKAFAWSTPSGRATC